MMMNAIKASMKSPYGKVDPLTVNVRFLASSVVSPIIPKRGVRKAVTKASIRSLKAPPTTRATARSTTLPLRMKDLKPAIYSLGKWVRLKSRKIRRGFLCARCQFTGRHGRLRVSVRRGSCCPSLLRGRISG